MNRLLNVYYGGSFFPPHRAHDEIVQHLLAHPDVEKVFLVPTFQNPLKALSQGAHQKRMLIETWLQSLETRNVEGMHKLVVDWRELESASASYTIDTLTILKTENPNTDWALCVGTDCLPYLDKWKNIEELLALLKEFWVFKRGALHEDEDSLGLIPSALRSQCRWRFLLPTLSDVSSTQLRALLEDGDAKQESLHSLLLPEVAMLLVDKSFRS